MSTSSSSIKTSSDRLTRVEGIVENLSKDFENLQKVVTKGFDNLYSSLDGQNKDSNNWREAQLKARQTNWFAVISIVFVILTFMFAVFCSCMGGLWMVISMQEKGDIQPLKDSYIQLMTEFSSYKKLDEEAHGKLDTVVAQNATSIRDRDDLRRDLSSYIIKQNEMDRDIHSIDVGLGNKLREVETQFHKVQDEINVETSTNQRKFNDIQNTLHEMNGVIPEARGGPYYYPSVPSSN